MMRRQVLDNTLPKSIVTKSTDTYMRRTASVD